MCVLEIKSNVTASYLSEVKRGCFFWQCVIAEREDREQAVAKKMLRLIPS